MLVAASEQPVKRGATTRTIGFAQLLMGLLFLALLASMSLIAVVSSYFTRKSVQELSDRIVQQTLARVELRISGLLEQAINQNLQARLLLAGRQLSSDDFKELGGFFAHSLDVLQDLSDLGFGLERNGDYVFAERLPDHSVRVREYVLNDAAERVIRDWRWYEAERQLLKEAPWDGYDPRKRPFYQLATAAQTNAWTETYPFWHANERGPVPGVTFATPYAGSNGQLLGVLNSDFDLEALCRFLGEVRKGMIGYPFLVERRQDESVRLIAHPDTNALAGGAGLSDPAAAEFMRVVAKNPPERAQAREGRIVTFEAQGQRYFGSARELRPPGQPAWTIAVIIPVDEVMAGVYQNDRRALWLGVVCLGLACLAAVVVARRIAEPLKLLTNEARAIGRLELAAKPEAPSRVLEVARLANSMSDMKTSLRSFQKFVPTEVVREIVASAVEARLGGRRATLTVFFSDVENFTSMAETMSPEQLVEHTGEYLGEMSRVIHAGNGTVDKFIGDGIMAFWGAPSPNPEHGRAACQTAVECQRALGRLRERWRQAGRPELRARIGLHTGPVIVGNIGSEDRLNYTAIGDSVNLTSRIEGLNKFYGTEILISAACVEAAGPAVLTRPVDNVSVKGRTEGIIVHELMGMIADSDAQARQASKLTAEAFAAYLRSEFPQAREMYQALLIFRPQDAVAALMETRCGEFIAGPRPTTWDTTFRMRDK